MNEKKTVNTSDLIRGIVDGKVPRQVRLFAAQGLLPVSREDLLGLQVLLSADPDGELARIAEESLRAEQERTILDWIATAPPDPLVLDLLIRVRESESIWAAVASHPNVSNETLRVLARNGSPLIQDILVTNQMRIFGCLEILDDLRANEQINQVILRRVREFEEEFIAKAIAEEEEDFSEAGPSVGQALDALRSIGAHIPREESMPYPRSDDPALEKAAKKVPTEIHARLMRMSVHERIVCALRGTKSERAVLINSRNRLVQRSVLACPKLTDNEVELFASSRSVAEEVIQSISENRRWLRQYKILIALAMNPKTPVYTANKLLPRLNHRDVVRISRDRNLNPVTRQMAQKLLSRRR
jgi:hypothetical protein